MRIAPQLFQTPDLRVVGGQVAQKAPKGYGVPPPGRIAERRRKGLRGTLEERLQTMTEGAVAPHD
jgi:hypothetical protein